MIPNLVINQVQMQQRKNDVKCADFTTKKKREKISANLIPPKSRESGTFKFLLQPNMNHN